MQTLPYNKIQAAKPIHDPKNSVKDTSLTPDNFDYLLKITHQSRLKEKIIRDNYKTSLIIHTQVFVNCGFDIRVFTHKTVDFNPLNIHGVVVILIKVDSDKRKLSEICSTFYHFDSIYLRKQQHH